MTKKRILISGGASGFAELAAIGLAKAGHDVIVGAQIWPQVTQLRLKSETLGLANLRVEKLDVLDSYDIQNAMKWDIDILVNNAAVGISGPMSEIPLELLRRSFETNFFAPLALTQGVVRKFVDEKRSGNCGAVWRALCDDQACLGGPRGIDESGAGAIRHSDPVDQSWRLSDRVQRNGSGVVFPLDGRWKELHQERRREKLLPPDPLSRGKSARSPAHGRRDGVNHSGRNGTFSECRAEGDRGFG